MLKSRTHTAPKIIKALQSFWASVKHSEWFRHHPILSSPDPWSNLWLHGLCCCFFFVIYMDHIDHLSEEVDLNKTIPLMLHGDDADSHRRRSFCVLTMGSVLVSGCSTFDSKLLLYITDNSRCTDETFAVLDKWLAWSLTELQLGFYLDIDAFGAPYKPHSDGRKGLIADGYRAVVCFYKGDEKYVQKCYKTSHSAVSKNCCFTCLASTETGPLLYTHHGRSASHRATILTTEQFITQVAGVRTFINIPGWHVSMLVYDWLHIVDLCIIPETSASTLVELTREAVFGDAGTQDERLRLAYVMFSRACKNAKIRCRGQIFSMCLGLCSAICCFFMVILICFLLIMCLGICTSCKETTLSCWAQIIPYFGTEALQWG